MKGRETNSTDFTNSQISKISLTESEVKEMKALQDRNVWVEKNPLQPFRE